MKKIKNKKDKDSYFNLVTLIYVILGIFISGLILLITSLILIL